MRFLSIFSGPDYNNSIVTNYTGDGLGIEYNEWDSDSILLCKCDNGYFGNDCSLSKNIYYFNYIINFII